MARWYVEAHKGESWHDVSTKFGEWLLRAAQLKSFGWSEGDSLNVGEKTLYCFHFPDQHGDKINLFPRWAESIGRLCGKLEAGRIHFPNDPHLVVVVPPEQGHPLPPWLK